MAFGNGSAAQHCMSEVRRMTDQVMSQHSHVDHLKPAFEDVEDEMVNDLLLADPGCTGSFSKTAVVLIANKHEAPRHTCQRRKVWIPRKEIQT